MVKVKTLKYLPQQLESKWQKRWIKVDIFKTPINPSKKKYVLDMFPYPSGATMHVGHLEGYVGTDILSRFLRMNGFDILHPMGWDAFGLPAENYAIKTNIHPDISTHKNIETFKRQLMISGLSYDWSREIDTSDPDFYRWTQWLFILMFKKGLAYKKKASVNWCPKDETVLANEQVISGRCERCETKVVQKELDQWFLKITDYADRLISGLEGIDWPEEVKVQQRNWIGRSTGMLIEFKRQNSKGKIEVFTTRPDTLNAATFLATAKLYEEGSKEKVGKFSGEYAINPLDGHRIPIWDTNYVAPGYGTGIIMGVPAHDVRDMEFAKKYQLDVIQKEPNQSLWQKIEANGWGNKYTTYHLKDWLISRQRYWGCPIPMIYCEKCARLPARQGWQPVSESELPVLLPQEPDFQPHGESPIARSKTFQQGAVCSKCHQKAKREVDTMDTYVDSSWYFIRFVDPKNKTQFASQEKIKKWLPVDIYVGGGHVVQHLLFARFFWKVLYDAGLIDKSLGDEPFLKLRAPGWILGADSRKMSKRWNNVVTPDDIIPKFGADTLRLYEMFMGPFEVMKPWSMTGVEGASRFLNRIWQLFQTGNSPSLSKKQSKDLTIKLHQTIKKVTEDIEDFKYNTAISALMIFVNTLESVAKSEKLKAQSENLKLKTKNRNKVVNSRLWTESLKALCLLMAPFMPHLTEEIWQTKFAKSGKFESVHSQSWPGWDPKLIQTEKVEIIVQVNGKVRGQLSVSRDQSTIKDKVEKLARDGEKVAKWLEGKKVNRVVFVPGKLINFVLG